MADGNGGFIGIQNAPTAGVSVPGIWTMDEVCRAKRAGLWPGGGLDSYTKLLAHFDGADGATSATEIVTGSSFTFEGNAQLDTAQSVFGGSSLLLDGSGDAVYTASSPGHGIGSADFAIECRVMFNGLPGSGTFMCFMSSGWDVSGQNGHFFGVSNSSGTRQIVFYWSTNGTATSSVVVNWTPSTGVWYHVVITRSGTTGRFFVDGTQVGSNQTISATIHTSTAAYRIGSTGNNNHYLNGWIDECRLSVGTPRWTANFTPQPSPYS
ncbi:Concanavalin A-like lectin/glucanases superfamily [Hyphomicrobium sp. 1Nfss2.1]|uniref:LamG domain-containing protein n=1 Tax=Hyphomicrobium sp. 1Nfss2.1 TaxID=3413936 RepID=UPI003C7B5BEA